MAENKTKENEADVSAFIESFVDKDEKKKESLILIQLMQKVTGYPPKMWGESIIGFGSYHYKYASGREGDAPLVGFSPRKAAFSLYVHSQAEELAHLLEGLGKVKISKGCIYAKRLADINLDKLETLMRATIKYTEDLYGKSQN
jgi:hypothetical protein